MAVAAGHLSGGRRLAVVAAGVVGAEILGAVGFAAGAGLLAIDLAAPAIAGLILAPVLAAAGGPFGYDVATAWAPEARATRAAAGARAGVHAAGVAGALFVLLCCMALAAAVPNVASAVLLMVVVLGLPTVAVAGRRFAMRFVESPTLLPVSLVAVVFAALAVFIAFVLVITRVFDTEA